MSLKSSRNAAETPEGRVAGRRRAGQAGLILPAGDAGTGDPEPGPVSGRGGSFLVPGGGARALLILPPLDRPEDEERLQVPGPGAFFAPPMPGAMSRSAVQRALSGQIAFAAQGRRVEGGAVAGPRSGNPRRKRAAPGFRRASGAWHPRARRCGPDHELGNRAAWCGGSSSRPSETAERQALVFDLTVSSSISIGPAIDLDSQRTTEPPRRGGSRRESRDR